MAQRNGDGAALGLQNFGNTDACPFRRSAGRRVHMAYNSSEVENDTVDSWASIPEYAAELDLALGDNGARIMRDACASSQRKTLQQR